MKRSLSRLPVSRNRPSSTSRVSSSTIPNTPSLIRSKSSLSLKRTPQSVKSSCKVRQKKKEIRPIHDKKWQAISLERVQHYFQQYPEGRQLLNKGVNIKPITLKMFVELTNVVLKNIDMDFDDLTLSNYTELLPFHLDILMYPGIVSASTLKTANTMHSWPHILAIMAWLVELHQLSSMIDVEETILGIPPNASLETQIKKSETKTIFDLFREFNKGKESDENQDKIIIQNMYKKVCNYNEDEYENLIKKLNKLEGEYQYHVDILSNDQQTISTLESENNMLNEKLKHLNDSIEAEKQINTDLISKKIEFLNDQETIIRNINKTEISIEKLKDTIKNQPMNLEQRSNDLKEIDELKTQIELIKEKKRHQLNLRDEKDMELSEIKRKIEQTVVNYNIELMRPSLQYSALNEIALREDKLLQPDMKEYIKDLTEMKQNIFNDLEMKITTTRDALASLKLIEENQQQTNNSIKQEIEEKTHELEMLNKEYENIQKSQEEVEKQKEIELNEIKQNILKLKEDNPNVQKKLIKLQESKENCEKLRERLFSKDVDMEKFFEKIEEEIRKKQIPRYEKIKNIMIEKVDKYAKQYSTPPSGLN